jgi:methyltransferase (TIGR00027 family)
MAAGRAQESEREDRLYDDPFARKLAGDAGFEWLARIEKSAGYLAFPPIRTRYFDDWIARTPRSQVVLLGAGMDARAQRLDWAPGTVLYEVDQPEVLAAKALILGGDAPRCERREVRRDLREPWQTALIEAGFDRERPSLWVLEGLLMYLDDASVNALLATVATLAAKGSAIGFDVPNPTLLVAPRLKPMLDPLAEMGAPWRFGCEDPAALLAAHGFEATVQQPGEPGADFGGRWKAPIAPKGQPGVRFFLVTATR